MPSPLADQPPLADHQRPKQHDVGRRSEAAPPVFHASTAPDPSAAPPSAALWAARPRVLITRSGQKDRITAACPHALALGMKVGMSAAHARALIPDLDVGDAQPDADHALLHRLALHAARHWTPSAAIDPDTADGLCLDLTGTTHLFGGEEKFCRRLLAFLQRLGLTGRIAIAGSLGAAHGLARYSGAPYHITAPRQETQDIAALPLAALRISPESSQVAARFGLEKIADLYAMPRGPLARRLGLSFVKRLDQARGLIPEPINPIIPFETPAVERRLLEPIITAEAITTVITDLIRDMVLLLEKRGLGLRAASLVCVRVDASEQIIPIGTARATRDAKHLNRLFGLRVEKIEADLGIETMRLIAVQSEAFTAHSINHDLISGNQSTDIAPLIDQLAGRVGETSLFRLSAMESDVPERAVRAIPPLDVPKGWQPWPRPTRLLKRPEILVKVVALLPDYPPRRFTWRGHVHDIVAGDGPERIHGEWWRSTREMWTVRDYFKIETTAGERFWIFRRGDAVQEKTGDLSWYMHGVFG